MAWWQWVAGGRPAAGKGLLLAALIAALVVSAPRADAAKPLMLGAWLPNGFDSSQIAPFQQMIGRRADIVAVSMPWSGPNGYLGFNVAAAWAYGVSRNGSVPMIGWEPMIGPGGASVYPAPLPGACPGQIASAPANDSVIQYIANFAHQVAAYRSIVLIRMMHEPNYAPPSGGWYWSLGANPWCGNVSESDYIAAWRRVVAIFRYEGATNAKFIWCINWQSWGVPDLVGSYPGDDVVDYTAIDATIGAARPGSPSISFSVRPTTRSRGSRRDRS